VNFRTTDWLKKLNTTPKIKTPSTLGITQPVSNPTQQLTGQVGGMQTTAQQTQPLSAQLGGWFGQKQGQQTNPFEAFMSWLSPQVAQMLRGKISSPSQSWTQTLPQNITNNLLKRKRGG
jgi:hypothetical protein